MPYQERLKSIQEKITDASYSAILITSVPNIIYLTGFANFFPEDGITAYLYITKNKAYYITSSLYTEEVQATVKHLEVIELNSKYTLSDFFSSISKENSTKVLGCEFESLKVSDYIFIKKFFKITNQKLLSDQRIFKTKEEIEKIKKACEIGDLAFEHILQVLKPGVSEKEIAFEIEMYIRKKNATLSFNSVVCFGENSSQMHHMPTDRILKEKEIILLDFGVKYHNYCSDMTRSLFCGKATKQQQKMYNAVLSAQLASFNLLKNIKENSLLLKDVDNSSRKIIEENHFPTFPHSLGHQIGLEVHEEPRISPNAVDYFKNGMVFSLEPGIYIPGYGGIRIEDLVIIENNKPIYITNSPKRIIELNI